MRRISHVICLLAVLWLAAPCAASSEMEQRRAVTNAAHDAFLSRDYARLERDSSLYRSDKSRTASGLWKLTFYYIGLSSAIDTLVGAADPSQSRDDVYKALVERTRDWSKKFPNSPSACLTRSMVYVAHAWDYRGTGYAATVKPDAWAPFHRNLALARKELEACKPTAAVDPRWYGSMLIVARAENWPRDAFDRLFDEAVNREPSYYQNYFTALEYLLPKWQGSLDEVEEFARDAERRSAREEGRGMYARIYWSMTQGNVEENLFTETQANWAHMKVGFDDIIARWPDDWNLNNYAKFACMARDRPKTRALLQRIGGRVVPQAWESPEMLESCARWSSEA